MKHVCTDNFVQDKVITIKIVGKLLDAQTKLSVKNVVEKLLGEMAQIIAETVTNISSCCMKIC